jgi:excisionase family DNA binding protein
LPDILTDETRLAYRPAEAAVALGIGRSRLYELLQAGMIPTRKLGPSTLILRADLLAFLDSLPAGNQAS